MELPPVEIIQLFVEERKQTSDEQILAELAAQPVLPDENDPAWDRAETWQRAYLYIALGDLSAMRRLRAAIPLLFERACYGDPGEIMRGLRHTLEAIINPDWDALAEECLHAASFPQPGARLWAVAELGILRDKQTLDVVVEALSDSARDVRFRACQSLAMICQTNRACRKLAILALQQHTVNSDEPEEQAVGVKTIEEIQQMAD